jgi:hypothetical protein
MRSFMLAIYDGRGMLHSWERSDMRAGLWERPKERNNWEELCIDNRMILKCWRFLVSKAVNLRDATNVRSFFYKPRNY